MITKEQALENVKKYLEERKRNYIRIAKVDEIKLKENTKVPYPFSKYYEKEKNMYNVYYDVERGYDEIPYFVYIDAETGEVLFTMTEHGYAEDWED